MKRQQNIRPQSMFRWLMVADGDHEESCQRFRHRRAPLGSTVRAGRGGRRFFGPRVEAVGSWRFSAADSDRRFITPPLPPPHAPRVPVFLLPRHNQNKRRSPECRGVDGDAVPPDAPCREVLPVRADPAALVTVSVVLFMLLARGVFSLPVDSNGPTKSDHLLRRSIYEAYQGRDGGKAISGRRCSRGNPMRSNITISWWVSFIPFFPSWMMVSWLLC
ncbi:unnamed protein product [Musa acuminata var. zebrina]